MANHPSGARGKSTHVKAPSMRTFHLGFFQIALTLLSMSGAGSAIAQILEMPSFDRYGFFPEAACAFQQRFGLAGSMDERERADAGPSVSILAGATYNAGGGAYSLLAGHEGEQFFRQAGTALPHVRAAYSDGRFGLSLAYETSVFTDAVATQG